jgi:hypothetical protein
MKGTRAVSFANHSSNAETSATAQVMPASAKDSPVPPTFAGPLLVNPYRSQIFSRFRHPSACCWRPDANYASRPAVCGDLLFRAGKIAPTSAIRRPVKRFSPKLSRIGAAMNMEELVASTRPNSRTTANSRRAGPPKSASGTIARKSATEVPMVRVRPFSCRLPGADASRPEGQDQG